MTLKQYLKEKNIDSIQDYSELCEAEWNAIEEYHSSYGFTDDDIRELENRGYWEEQSVNEEWHETVINGEKEGLCTKEYQDKIEACLFGGGFCIEFQSDKYGIDDVIRDITSNYEEYRWENFDAEYRAWCD